MTLVQKMTPNSRILQVQTTTLSLSALKGARADLQKIWISVSSINLQIWSAAAQTKNSDRCATIVQVIHSTGLFSFYYGVGFFFLVC